MFHLFQNPKIHKTEPESKDEVNMGWKTGRKKKGDGISEDVLQIKLSFSFNFSSSANPDA